MLTKMHNTSVHTFALEVSIYTFYVCSSYGCIVAVAGVACGTLTKAGGAPTLESSLVMSFSHMVFA